MSAKAGSGMLLVVLFRCVWTRVCVKRDPFVFIGLLSSR